MPEQIVVKNWVDQWTANSLHFLTVNTVTVRLLTLPTTIRILNQISIKCPVTCILKITAQLATVPMITENIMWFEFQPMSIFPLFCLLCVVCDYGENFIVLENNIMCLNGHATYRTFGYTSFQFNLRLQRKWVAVYSIFRVLHR